MRVRVYLYYGDVMYDLLAEKSTTLRELLEQSDIPEDTVLFSSRPSEPNKTPLINLDKTLVDYNMWFPEKSYVAELSAYNKTDNYNKELYEMYLNNL
jgi:hypothetical protein